MSDTDETAKPIPKPKKATWRMAARQRERLQWFVVGIICLLLFFAFRPVVLHMIDVRNFQTCQSNMLKIAGAIGRYEQDWDGGLPVGSNWTDSLQFYVAATSGTGFKDDAAFQCPLDNSHSGSSYAFNALLSGISSDAAARSPEAAKRAELFPRLDRAPLLIEKHGSSRNAVVELRMWDDVRREMTLPHVLGAKEDGSPDHGGTLIMGDAAPSRVTSEQLAIRAGNRF
jgi:hypothetical protein